MKVKQQMFIILKLCKRMTLDEDDKFVLLAPIIWLITADVIEDNLLMEM